ncbi:hypothetical protein [Prevotella sp. OH937_COT-195]|uniref:hypothetical protein n=1 Tax=Prevotella sp. OH937_COT-195 TaxID=2491051 RepID=UPI000F647A73|nr:hypothetical protein [Prevotella sp. OH937_COT-195]RRC97449.1 hypothetical protein EII32_10460 [Prevotella sp. OH937_COT-195]
MKQNYKKYLVLTFLLLCSLTITAENVIIKFAQGAQNVTANAYLINPSTLQEEKLIPAADGFTYEVSSGSKVRLEAIPDEGYVVYVWKGGSDESSMTEMRGSYSATQQVLENVTSNKIVTLDVCKLVPVTFIVPGEGSEGAEVNVEEQGDFGRVIAPEADGITYMLPEGRGAYFDPRPTDGYNILVWSFGNNLYFPSRPDQFYKQNIPNGFYLTILFYKDGEKRTITYTQPQTAVITCHNHSESGSPVIESGTDVTPGDHILFEIAPFDNPAGKVPVAYWEVNGQPYVDAAGDYITDNSVTFIAVENLDVKVVIEGEVPTGMDNVASQSMMVMANASAVSVTGTEGVVAIYDIRGTCLGKQESINGKATFRLQGIAKGDVIIVVAGDESKKIVLN